MRPQTGGPESAIQEFLDEILVSDRLIKIKAMATSPNTN